MNLYRLEPGISLVDLNPPIPNFEGMLGAYILQAEKVALLDVGPTCSLDTLFQALVELQISPERVDYILTTHIHIDHSGGIGGAMRRLPKAKAIVHEKGLYHLAHPAKLWEGSLRTLRQMAAAYGEPEPVPEDRLIAAREGAVIDLGSLQLEILLTPGHAPHHLSYLDRKRGKLFAGEAAGVYFPKTTMTCTASPPPFELKQAIASLNKLIAARPVEIYYPHFGSAPDALTRLSKMKSLMIAWARTIARHPDGRPEELIEELWDLDGTGDIIRRLPSGRLQNESFFINNNILGYLDYFKREGTGMLAELEKEAG
jgi:glyoxylase-like metal-dependent hydrolase (beta-lactamase superfamily II)